MNKKYFIIFFVSLYLVLTTSCLASASEKRITLEKKAQARLAFLVESNKFNALHAVAIKAASIALKDFDLKKDNNLLVLTNAGNVRVNNLESNSCLDALTVATNCTIGKGNLLTIHSNSKEKLYFFFFHAKTGKAVYLEVDCNVLKTKNGQVSYNQAMLKKDKDLFSYQALSNIGFSQIAVEPEKWEKKVKNKIFHGREFALITMANLWANGAPIELVRSAQFHDHLCPGVTAGYFLANYLLEKFPLSAEESYYIIASPAWCKDDALQVILNTTVGKQTMLVYPLSESDKKCLLPEAKDATGFYFIYDKNLKIGKGIVLGFDWDKLCQDSGIDFGQKFSWLGYMKCDLWMCKHLSDYDKYVHVIKNFELEKGKLPSDYVGPDINPWKKLGLWKNR